MQCPHCKKHFISKATQRPAPMRDRILDLLVGDGLTCMEVSLALNGEKSPSAISTRLIRYEQAGLVRRNGYKKVEWRINPMLPAKSTHYVTRWVCCEKRSQLELVA